MKNPLVSIITPCYNGAKYINRLFDSILEQRDSNIEFIIIDDGSLDNSLDIQNKYKSKFAKKNISYHIISKENGGAASAINEGLKIFSGDYVTFIDADDFLNDHSLMKRVGFLEENQQYDAVYSATNIVDASDYNTIKDVLRPTNKSTEDLFENMLMEKDYIWTPAYLIRSSYFISKHPTRHIEEFSAGQNIQLYLPLWYKGAVGYINEPLVTIVAHDDSHSRIDRGHHGQMKRRQEIMTIFKDTLARIDMSDSERKKYNNLLDEKYSRTDVRIFQDIRDSRDEMSRLYDRDEERFRGAYFTDPELANQDQLASRLVFSAHSLEKSLSNDGFEVGHGFGVVSLLIELLNTYTTKGYDKNHLAYTSTLSALKSFYNKHRGTEYEKKVETIIGDWSSDIYQAPSRLGGADHVYIDTKKDNNKKNFRQLAEGRYAIRTYADKPVNKTDIEDAVSIATKTPSVCNRQPVRVRAMYDKDVIEKVLKVQGGIDYYDTPPALLLITVDDSSYLGANERNQGYIDGGLFAMSLLYALEYKKLAACPLHAMFETERDFKIRGMLDIADNEKLITFISVGHFTETSGVCRSFRYPVEQILSESNRIHNYKVETISHNVSDPIVEEYTESQPNSDMRVYLKACIGKIRCGISRRMDIIEYGRADGAILTLTGYFNYGNVIQRFALQRFLKIKGYNFVSYLDPYSAPRSDYSTGRGVYLKTPLRVIKRFIRHQKPYWYVPSRDNLYPESRKIKHIIDFVENNIWTKPFDERDTYKTYIVGSDQVWRNWWGDSKILGYYFFTFLKTRQVKKIAYAASFGQEDLSESMSAEDINYIAEYIHDIDSISVRESSAKKVLKDNWNIDSIDEVVDPTLLLKSSEYSLLIDKSDVRETKIAPIFAYIIDENTVVKNFIDSIGNSRKQKTFCIRAHVGAEDDTLPPVELWLKGFRDAELVITNSFHGILFSVINNTDFIVIGREAGGNSRVKDFLHKLGLSDRFIEENSISLFDISSLDPIDWGKVNAIANAARTSSEQWLLNSLSARH